MLAVSLPVGTTHGRTQRPPSGVADVTVRFIDTVTVVEAGDEQSPPVTVDSAQILDSSNELKFDIPVGVFQSKPAPNLRLRESGGSLGYPRGIDGFESAILE